MKLMTKILAPAGMALCALAATATPVAAQVDGRMATIDIARTIIGTSALQNAYQQVTTTYAAQIETRRTKQQELSTLLQPFDSNQNNQLDEAELPAVQNSPSLTQIQTLEQEIATITQQVNNARIYAIEQIAGQYPAALQEVVSQQQVALVFSPATVLYAPQEADITQQVITSLNSKVPSVGIVPPADWQPTRNVVQLFQEIQQTLLTAQLIQQQQQAQQQGQQPAQGNNQAPTGR